MKRLKYAEEVFKIVPVMIFERIFQFREMLATIHIRIFSLPSQVKFEILMGVVFEDFLFLFFFGRYRP
jgi:hypothetical protein